MAVPTAPAAGEPIAEAWGDVVHDTVVAQDIQHGKATLTVTAAAETGLVVTFPRPFASAPDCIVTIGEIGGSANRPMVAKVSSGSPPTATNFQIVLQNVTGVATSLTIPVWWMAIGPRA